MRLLVHLNMGFVSWVEWEMDLKDCVISNKGFIFHWPKDDIQTMFTKRRYRSVWRVQRVRA